MTPPARTAQPSVSAPPAAGAKSFAVLQTGLLGTWLWSHTVDLVVTPNVLAGWSCSYFGLFQTGNAARASPGHNQTTRVGATAASSVQSTAFRRAMQLAGGRVALLEQLPPLEAISSSWQTFSVQWPGPPENIVRKQFLLSRGMEAVLLDATPFDWVLWIREDAGWWAPLSLDAIYALPGFSEGSVLYTTPCLYYGVPDKAWLADRRVLTTLARALYTNVFQAGNNGALLVDESLGERRAAFVELGRVSALAGGRQRASSDEVGLMDLLKRELEEQGRRAAARATNTEHVVQLILQAHGISHRGPAGSWNSSTGRMTAFGLAVSDARRLSDGRGCLRSGTAGGFHGANQLLLPRQDRNHSKGGSSYDGGCGERLGSALSRTLHLEQRYAGGYCT